MGLEEFWMAGAGVLNVVVFYFGFLYHSEERDRLLPCKICIVDIY